MSICAPSLQRGPSIVTSLMLTSVAYVHPGECELFHICFFLMHLTAIIYVHCMVDRTSMYLYIYTSIEVHLYIACIIRASGVRYIGTERRLRSGLRENSIRCRQRQTPFGSHGHGELTSIRPPATTLGRFSVEGMF